MRRAARRGGALCALVAGCAGETIAPSDAGRFEVREATVAPLDAVDVLVDDLGTTVDVRVADVSASRDAAVFDGAASDAPAVCVDLANQHAAAVREAQRCLTDQDCDTAVCETLCCACQVFVHGTETTAVRALLARGEAEACPSRLDCPRVPCARPTRGLCSSEGRCVTLREAPGTDGGALDALP